MKIYLEQWDEIDFEEAVLFWDIFIFLTSFLQLYQRYRVLQTIQMKPILLCVWAEWAVLGSAKTALKFKYEI